MHGAARGCGRLGSAEVGDEPGGRRHGQEAEEQERGQVGGGGWAARSVSGSVTAVACAGVAALSQALPGPAASLGPGGAGRAGRAEERWPLRLPSLSRPVPGPAWRRVGSRSPAKNSAWARLRESVGFLRYLRVGQCGDCPGCGLRP